MHSSEANLCSRLKPIAIQNVSRIAMLHEPHFLTIAYIKRDSY